MGVKGIEGYFRGYIVVKVEGLNPEKLLNLASKNGITMSDIIKINFTTLEFKMKYSQYKGLKKIAKLTHCRVKIVKKYGFVFQMYKLKTRSFFIFGVIVFLCILFLLSSIIWKIEIDGNKRISSDKINQCLEKSGIKKGKIKYNLKLREIENALQNEIKEISVVNIKIVGTKIKVNIVERTMPPEIIKQTPSNIIAGKEGIITKILSYKGQPAVKIGDYVKKDQVLISGVLTDINNFPISVGNAMGDVYAKTWYEGIGEVNFHYKRELKTGITKQKIYLMFLGKKIYLKNDNIDFEKYDKIIEKNNLNIKGMNTKIEKITETYYQKIEENINLTEDEAYKIAVENAENIVYPKLPQKGKLLDKKFYKEINEKSIKVRILYLYEENIGIVQELK